MCKDHSEYLTQMHCRPTALMVALKQSFTTTHVFGLSDTVSLTSMLLELHIQRPTELRFEDIRLNENPTERQTDSTIVYSFFQQGQLRSKAFGDTLRTRLIQICNSSCTRVYFPNDPKEVLIWIPAGFLCAHDRRTHATFLHKVGELLVAYSGQMLQARHKHRKTPLSQKWSSEEGGDSQVRLISILRFLDEFIQRYQMRFLPSDLLSVASLLLRRNIRPVESSAQIFSSKLQLSSLTRQKLSELIHLP